MEVKTYLRIRPIVQSNKNLFSFSDDKKCLILKDNGSTKQNGSRKSINGQPVDQVFNFDGVFEPDISQNELFNEVCLPVLDNALYKSTCTAIIGQGETKSGKTYSIFGSENIQQEEFSIDQEDPKDSRGFVLKAIHYIFKKGKHDGKQVTLDCQMLDLYADTLRDLSKGKTNKFNKQSVNSLLYERDKEVEIDETQNGEIVLTNLQTVKINNPKEAASFIEKCLDYQKKLEKDNGTYCSLAHTVFVINLTYGMDVKSQIYFVDLGSSERSEGKKLKEGFVVQGNVFAFNKYLSDFQCLMSEDERDLYSFKEFKLTYLLRNLFKDYQKVAMLSHLYLTDQNLPACLRTLEINEKIKSNSLENVQKKNTSLSDLSQSNIEDGEYNIDQIIQNLNKDNFELRNNIETMKKSHKIKMEELQSLLNIPCEIDYLLKNKDTAPQVALIHEQRKALEKADGLIRSNKDYEKRIEYLTFDLKELKKDKIVQQETFSQQFIQLAQQLEVLREEKVGHKMNLENNLRMQKAYSQVELRNINRNALNMLSTHQTLSKKVHKNAVFAKDEQDSNHDIRDQLDDIKDKGFQESELKFTRLYQLQIKTQEKELARIKEQQNAQIKSKDDMKIKMAQTFQKYKLKKDHEMREAKDELIKMYEVSIKQDQVIQGLIRGDYSGAGQTTKIPDQDIVKLPSQESFPRLFQEVDCQKEKGIGYFGQSRKPSLAMQNMQQTMKANMQFDKTMDQYKMTGGQTTIGGGTMGQDKEILLKVMVKKDTKEMDYSSLRQHISQLQNEIKKIKQKPLNPDNIRVDKIKELLQERDRYKDLYISESIKNKDHYEPTDRNMRSQSGQRPMTTMSSVSSFKQSLGLGGGGFFVTNMAAANQRFREKLVSSQSSKRLPSRQK